MDDAETREPPAIAAAVIIAYGSVLMIRRRVAEGALSWQFPAGKIEPGETAADAAVRETLEETALTVRAIAHLGKREHPVTGRRMIYIGCDVVAGTARVAAEREVAEVRWCDRATLADLVTYPFAELVQEHLDAHLR